MGQISAFGRSKEQQADKSVALLRTVEQVLAAHGVRTLLVQRVSLKLRGPSPALPDSVGSGLREYHAPELAVFGAEGKQVATVTVGTRSGSYVVSAKGGGMETADRPDQVMSLLADICLP